MTNLDWECGSEEVRFDATMMFGKGYDFFGLECRREEADTPLGRFVIWPDYMGVRESWSLYGGALGLFKQGFPTKDAVKAEVQRMADGVKS